MENYKITMSLNLEGIITPTITPIKNGEVDKEAVKALIEYLESIKVNGIFPLGSTGCAPIISLADCKKVLDAFSKYINGMLLLPGVGRNNLSETLELAKYAKDIGADAIVIVTPYYMKMDNESIYKYYYSILSSIDKPIIAYNIPQLTGNNLNYEVLMKLLNDFYNLVGLKDSSGNLSNFQDYIINLPKNFKIFQGQDELLLSSLIIGASGGICGTTNFSNLAVDVYLNYKSGNFNKAKELQEKLSRIKNYLSKKSFPQSYNASFYKLILKKNYTGACFPLRDLTIAEIDEIYEFIKQNN